MDTHYLKHSHAEVNGKTIHNNIQGFNLNNDGLQYLNIDNGNKTSGFLTLQELTDLISIDLNDRGGSIEKLIKQHIPKNKKKRKTTKRRRRKKKQQRRSKRKGTT